MRVNQLESVQKFALKMISHRWDVGYEDLVNLVDLPTLKRRRLHLKLGQVYKIIHELCDFPDVFQVQATRSNRLARDFTIHCPFARTNYFYHSFVPNHQGLELIGRVNSKRSHSSFILLTHN